MKMKFLFIVTSFWAYGELQIAVDFALKASNLGHEIMFLIPSSHVDKIKGLGIAYRILVPKAASLNRIILMDIEDTFKPSFVILSDFLNYCFCERHYGLTTDDLSAFSGLIGAFDIYNFSLTGKKIDTYGFHSKEISNLSVDGYDFLLQPCPVVNPVLNKKANHFRYRIFGGLPARTRDGTKKAREKMGIAPSEKLVIMTGAVWQSGFRQYDNVKKVAAVVDDAIMKTVSRLDENYKVIWVGSRHNALPKNLNQITQVDSMLLAEFDALVECADVFVSTNYVSTSMIRAALRGVPVVLLGNSHIKTQEKSYSLTGASTPDILKEIDIAYPFRMFPIGWYAFLNPVVKNNPFYKLVKCAEIFDVEETLKAVKEAAKQSPEKCLDNLGRYEKKWLGLPDVEAIIESMSKLRK